MKNVGLYCEAGLECFQLRRQVAEALAAAGWGVVVLDFSIEPLPIVQAAWPRDGRLIEIPNSHRIATQTQEHIGEKILTDLQNPKKAIYENSDAFVVMPGGIRVVDALMEHLTWLPRVYRPKPVFLLNTNDYWKDLLDTFESMREQQFLPARFTERFAVAESVSSVITGLHAYFDFSDES